MTSISKLGEYGIIAFEYDKENSSGPTKEASAPLQYIEGLQDRTNDPIFQYQPNPSITRTDSPAEFNHLSRRMFSPTQAVLGSPSAPRRLNLLSRKITTAIGISKEDARDLSEEILQIYKFANEPGLRSLKYNGLKFKRKETGFGNSYLAHGDEIFVHLNTEKIKGGFKIAANALRIQLPSCSVQEIIHKKIRKFTDIGEKEVNLQSQLTHPSIPKIYVTHKYYNQFEPRISVYEYKCDITGENVFRKDKLPEFNQKTQFFSEIASGVSYLHHKGLCHNDLKLDNVMISHGKGMLIDFGLMTQTGSVPPYSCEWMRAPEREISNTEPVSFASDIYHFGLMLVQAFVPNAKPLIDVKDLTFIPSINKALYNWLPATEQESKMKRLIDACLSNNPQDRPTIDDIKSALRNL